MNDPEKYEPGSYKLEYTFDFFNYAGIHRPVSIYATPKSIFISDIKVKTQSVNVDKKIAVIKYEIITSMENEQNFGIQCSLEVVDHMDEKLGEFNECRNTVQLNRVSL